MIEFFFLFSLLVVPLIGLLSMVSSAVSHADKVVLKPLDWFKSREQPRKDFGTEAELRALGESLKERQLQPVVCLPDGTIVCGERRLRAAKLVGLLELEVKILAEQLSETAIRAYMLIENLLRKDNTPQEQVHGCIELMALEPQLTRKQVAARLHVDPSLVTRWCSYLDSIPEIQKAFDEFLIGLTDMYTISRLPKEQMLGLLNLRLSGEAKNRTELEQVVRKQRNGSNGNSVKANKVKIPLASGTVVNLAGDELSMDDVVESLSETLKEARKANEAGYDVKTWASMMKDKAAKG